MHVCSTSLARDRVRGRAQRAATGASALIMCDVSFLPRPCAVSVTTGHVQLFPYHIDHLLYSTLAMNMGCASYPVHSTNGTIVWSQDEVGAASCVACPRYLPLGGLLLYCGVVW